MHQLFEALLYGFQKSSPIITIDSTSFPIHLFGYRVSAWGHLLMSRDNYAQRRTAWPHERAILLDGVAGRPAV